MSVLKRTSSQIATRSLELMLLQFLVMVVLPNTEIGTSELPAVTAHRLAGAQGRRLAAPSREKPPVSLARSGQPRPRTSGLSVATICRACARWRFTVPLAQRLRI